MMRKPNYYNQAISILQELHKDFPMYNMGRHLSTALSDYGDVWGLSDKEIAFALDKYKSELALDYPHTDDKEIDKIINEGMNLDDILKEEDNGEDY
jgi:hypothetical protein